MTLTFPASDTPDVRALFELLKHHSFRQGTFTLSSGKTSNYYMDGRMTTLSAEGSRLIGKILAESLAPLKLRAIGGLTLGADPIVTAVTVASAIQGTPMEGFLIRKEAKAHGTGRQVEGHLQPGDRVVLLEDVITTGKSFIQAIEAVRAVSEDIEIVAMVALVDRKDGAQDALAHTGIPIHTLFTIDAFLNNA